PSIHFLWKQKISSDIKSFSNIESFRQGLRHAKKGKRLFLVDFELGAEQTGLELIHDLGIGDTSVLVTSVFSSTEIQDKVITSAIGIIPKFLIDQIKIGNMKDGFYDYVFIDDDSILRLGWGNRADKSNVKLLTLASVNEFRNHLPYISKSQTQIYIDS